MDAKRSSNGYSTSGLVRLRGVELVLVHWKQGTFCSGYSDKSNLTVTERIIDSNCIGQSKKCTTLENLACHTEAEETQGSSQK